MILMSIDQSLSSTGVMIWGKELLWFRLTSSKEEDVTTRITSITKQLKDLCLKHNVTDIVIESLPYGINSTSVRPLAGLYYCISTMCKDLRIPFNEANVTGVKKLATGSGKAKKADMIDAFINAAPELHEGITSKNIRKTTGLADLADAYWIGVYHRSKTKDKKWAYI